jgi:hypothetical protein
MHERARCSGGGCVSRMRPSAERRSRRAGTKMASAPIAALPVADFSASSNVRCLDATPVFCSDIPQAIRKTRLVKPVELTLGNRHALDNAMQYLFVQRRTTFGRFPFRLQLHRTRRWGVPFEFFLRLGALFACHFGRWRCAFPVFPKAFRDERADRKVHSIHSSRIFLNDSRLGLHQSLKTLRHDLG